MNQNKKVRLVIGLIVAVVSFTYLIGYAIPNVQRAQEVQRQAQAEYDQAVLEQEQAMDELNTSINEITSQFVIPMVFASSDESSDGDEGSSSDDGGDTEDETSEPESEP